MSKYVFDNSSSFKAKSELILECCGKPESECRCDKPDESREDNLVEVIEPILQKYKDSLHKGPFSQANIDFRNFAAHDIAKIVIAKDLKFEQARVERIFREIDSKMELEQCDEDVMPYFNEYYWIDKDDWQSLKKQELNG